MTPLTPRPVAALTTLPDGSLGILDERGAPVDPAQVLTMTAANLVETLSSHHEAGRQAGAELIQSAVDATAQSVAQRAFVAGQQYTAAEIMAKSRVRRKIERDANDRIVSIVDVREPLPQEPEREPMGFRPRRPRQTSKETP